MRLEDTSKRYMVVGRETATTSQGRDTDGEFLDRSEGAGTKLSRKFKEDSGTKNLNLSQVGRRNLRCGETPVKELIKHIRNSGKRITHQRVRECSV